MDFLKKHYEKVILSIVLLGLAVASALLPMKVSSVKDMLQETSNKILNPPRPNAYTNLNIASNLSALKRLERPEPLDLSLPHHVFNPVEWQINPDGTKQKHDARKSRDVAAVQVLSISPLYLEIAFTETVPSDNNFSYKLNVKHETGRSTKTAAYLAKLNERKDNFMLVEVRGPRDAPNELVLEFLETKKRIVLSKENPFRQPTGYQADLKYEPENKTYAKVRKDDKITVARQSYKIIEINSKEVVLSGESGKRTILAYNALN